MLPAITCTICSSVLEFINVIFNPFFKTLTFFHFNTII